VTDLETHISPEQEIARSWIDRFDAAMNQGDEGALTDLFVPDAHWRDLVALTWTMRTTNGREAIVEGLLAARSESKPTSFKVAPARPAPKVVTRGDVDVLEAFIDFETAAGIGAGLVRLDASQIQAGNARAWGLLTSLESLSTETPPAAFGEDFVFERHDPRVDWSAHRKQRLEYSDREPEVLVVGGGHCGLTIAARLRELGHDALIVERLPRIGDNWRTRYDTLMLHTLTSISPFPYIPFPATFPQFLSKDKYGYWLESYAENLELDFWTSSELVKAEYDAKVGTWTATVRREDGTERVLRPKHIVMATGGLGSTPNVPRLPGLETFGGTVVHSADFRSGEDFRGKSVLVVGAGVSAHDIIFDLHGRGCQVAMLQRGSVTVVSAYTAHLPFFQGDLTLSPADGALIAAADFHERVMTPLLVRTAREGREHDRELLAALERAGMALDNGPDETGYLYKGFRYGGGYYIDVGCSELIANGEVPVLQFNDVDKFTPSGLRLRDDRKFDFDAVILATGFLNQQTHVEEIFGRDVADSIGEVFRLSVESGEFTNSWVPTPQPGLWFMNGGIAMAKPMSRYLALNLSAALSGLKPE
jgi:putative flavoprotein involved in K+ transport